MLENEYTTENLKCCGNCLHFTEESCPMRENVDVDLFNYPEPNECCASWVYDNLLLEKRAVDFNNVPTFFLEPQSFLGMLDSNSIEKFSKIKSLFKRETPNIKKIYIHGALEDELGYDLCVFISGIIKDVEIQDAFVFDTQNKKHKARIVMTVWNGNRYAYIISDKEDAEMRLNEIKSTVESHDGSI